MSGLFAGYAELGEVCISLNQELNAGYEIGKVGTVINVAQVNDSSPGYVKQLVADGLESMLHFELHECLHDRVPGPFGGPLYGFIMVGQERPTDLLDPTPYLKELEKAT